MTDFSKLLDQIDGDNDSSSTIHDGTVLIPGSEKAKKLWDQVDQEAHSPENVAKAKTISGSEKATGMFLGKALIPGLGNPNNVPEGDFDFLVAKLHIHDGHPLDVAQRIAASVKQRLYYNNGR